MRPPDGIVLVSCYELGRAPLGIAAPAAFLRRAGFEPRALDLSSRRIDDLPADVWRRTWLVAVSVPMHTALVLGTRAIDRIRRRAPGATVVFHGAYASLNARHLLERGVDAVVGGESESPLVALARSLSSGGGVDGIDGVATRRAATGPHLDRPDYPVPDRTGLDDDGGYAALAFGNERRRASAVETTRGCKHRCRHCPIPPVYGGRFVAIPREVVLADVDAVVASGARHVTFADPDFLNGPTHARRIALELHRRHPEVTFDFTAKVEHLLAHRDVLEELAASGAVFAVTAVETLNDDVLRHLDKGHTGDDARRAVDVLRRVGIAPRPSLMPFTPWESRASYGELLAWIAREDLFDHVDPVHLSIRLLVPPGSLLETHPAMTPHLRGLDAERFQHRWSHPDPRMDALQAEVESIARRAATDDAGPRDAFARIRDAWLRAADGCLSAPVLEIPPRNAVAAPPRLTEPWFC